jgi:hypothetical protein
VWVSKLTTGQLAIEGDGNLLGARRHVECHVNGADDAAVIDRSNLGPGVPLVVSHRDRASVRVWTTQAQDQAIPGTG